MFWLIFEMEVLKAINCLVKNAHSSNLHYSYTTYISWAVTTYVTHIINFECVFGLFWKLVEHLLIKQVQGGEGEVVGQLSCIYETITTKRGAELLLLGALCKEQILYF